MDAIHDLMYKQQLEMKMNNSKETKLKKEMSDSQVTGGTLNQRKNFRGKIIFFKHESRLL
jgi:hypothetical protein